MNFIDKHWIDWHLPAQNRTHTDRYFWKHSNRSSNFGGNPISIAILLKNHIADQSNPFAIQLEWRNPFVVHSFCMQSLLNEIKISTNFTHHKTDRGEQAKITINTVYIVPSMTTSTGSTPMSVQNRSIAYGPSTSGSFVVVYCLNQLMQRLLLNPSSTRFVRRELQKR